MQKRVNKKVLFTAIFLALMFIPALTHIPDLVNYAVASEAVDSSEDYTDDLGYIEWDVWANFSSDPDIPSMAQAQALQLASIGNMKEVYICANPTYGQVLMAHFVYGVNVDYTKKPIIVGGIITGYAITLADDYDDGWELGSQTVDASLTKSEAELVREGPSQAGDCDNIITVSGDQMNTALPTSSNYTLGTENIHGVSWAAGGDKSLNELGEDYATAGGVTFYDIHNSTEQCVITADDDAEDVMECVFTTYDQASSSMATTQLFGSLKRFSHRVLINPAKKATSSVAKLPVWAGKKAKTVVSSVGQTAYNALKMGAQMIAKPFQWLGSKFMLIIAIIVVVVLLSIFMKRR